MSSMTERRFPLPYVHGPAYGPHFSNPSQWSSPRSAGQTERESPDFGHFSPEGSVASSNLSTPTSSLSYSPYHSLGYAESMNEYAQNQTMADTQYRACHSRDPFYLAKGECHSPQRPPYAIVEPQGLGSPYKAPLPALPPMHSPKPAYPCQDQMPFEESEGSPESAHEMEERSAESPKSPNKRRVTPELKRSRVHAEKKRRDDMREHLTIIQQLLPDSACTRKLTKTRVVEQAAKYIVNLQRSQYKLQHQCDVYATEIAVLRRQLAEVTGAAP